MLCKGFHNQEVLYIAVRVIKRQLSTVILPLGRGFLESLIATSIKTGQGRRGW